MYIYLFIYICIFTGVYFQYSLFFYKVTNFKKVEDLIIEGFLKLSVTKKLLK